MADIDNVIDNLVNLTRAYGQTNRATIDPARFAQLGEGNEENIKESLLTHVGHLPIVATMLFPHLKNANVDLGRALVMLAVHDIGETTTGDVFLFTKTIADEIAESEAAYTLLEEELHEAYESFNNLADDAAKFAMSCDKLVADLLELLLPSQVSLARYAEFMSLKTAEQIIAAKRNKKARYMDWNPFLAELYERLLQKLQAHLES